MVEDTMCMHYTLERLGEVVTQTHLDEFMDEIKHNIRVNEEWRKANPPSLPEQVYDDFDVGAAIDRVKADYIERALARSKNVTEAYKLLGLNNYQTLQSWMKKLGMEMEK